MRIAAEAEMRRSLFDLRQQQVLDRIEADEAAADRILHGRRDLAFREVLQQPENLDVLALATMTEAGLHQTAEFIKGRIEPSVPQRHRRQGPQGIEIGHERAPHEPGAGMGQDHEKHMRLQPEASHLDHRLAEVCLGMARWTMRRHGRLAPRQALLADIVFDDGVAAVEAVLVA